MLPFGNAEGVCVLWQRLFREGKAVAVSAIIDQCYGNLSAGEGGVKQDRLKGESPDGRLFSVVPILAPAFAPNWQKSRHVLVLTAPLDRGLLALVHGMEYVGHVIVFLQFVD